MSAEFSVEVDELLAVVGELARCGEALDRLLDDVAGRVTRLHLTWAGEAADAQVAAQSAWEGGFRDMRGALAAMRQAAEVAHDNYTSAAAANLRMWERVR
jgi:WXG100 family type VII secretion target